MVKKSYIESKKLVRGLNWLKPFIKDQIDFSKKMFRTEMEKFPKTQEGKINNRQQKTLNQRVGGAGTGNPSGRLMSFIPQVIHQNYVYIVNSHHIFKGISISRVEYFTSRLK